MTIRKAKSKDDSRAFFSIDSFAENVKDPVGCGDSLLAYSTLAYKISKNDLIASVVGILSSSIEAEIDGNLPVKFDQLINKLQNLTTFLTNICNCIIKTRTNKNF